MWTSDYKRKVPFFANQPDFIAIEDETGHRVAEVPLYTNMPLEEGQARAKKIVEAVNLVDAVRESE